MRLLGQQAPERPDTAMEYAEPAPEDAPQVAQPPEAEGVGPEAVPMAVDDEQAAQQQLAQQQLAQQQHQQLTPEQLTPEQLQAGAARRCFPVVSADSAMPGLLWSVPSQHVPACVNHRVAAQHAAQLVRRRAWGELRFPGGKGPDC